MSHWQSLSWTSPPLGHLGGQLQTTHPAPLTKFDLWNAQGKQKKEAEKEEKKEIASIQFDYWLEHEFKPWMEKKTVVLETGNLIPSGAN